VSFTMPCPTAKMLQPSKTASGPLPGLEPLRVAKPIPAFLEGSKRMFTGNKLYLLLAFVPLAFLSEHLEWSDATIFGIACLAILPLAGMLGDATEQVALHTNDTLGGLLNATFGNATEVIVCYFALKADLLDVVKVSLLGSILSNTLLVLGGAILAGGIVQKTSTFNQTVAAANTTLLQISILALVVPALMKSAGQLPEGGIVDLELSRSISIALLVLYVFYVYFQLVTHKDGPPSAFKAPQEWASKTLKPSVAFPRSGNGGDSVAVVEEEEEEEVIFSMGGGLFWLLLATVAIAFLSELLTGSIQGAAAGIGLTQPFVGFVILPIIGNAAEHSTAITMAAKGKMDLAFGVALGSSTQIALFVIPLMVLVSWAMGKSLDLFFGNFETAVMFMSSLIVSHVVGDGESNWLEGVMLLFAYAIICFAFFFYVPP